MHPCRTFMDPRNLCGSSQLGTPSYPCTIVLCSSGQNHSCRQIPFGCRESCAVCPHRDPVHLEMYLEAVTERVWWCPWRRRLSELRDALRGCNQATLGAIIVRTWRSSSSECGDALGGYIRVNSEMHLEAVSGIVWRCTWRLSWVISQMHLEAVIEWVWRCTWRPWSSEFGDPLSSHDRWRLEE